MRIPAERGSSCADFRFALPALYFKFQIDQRLISYHDFNERSRSHRILDMLAEGHDVALVSDAGTPLVSDPGYKLVRDCLDLGLPVTSVPGRVCRIVNMLPS